MLFIRWAAICFLAVTAATLWLLAMTNEVFGPFTPMSVRFFITGTALAATLLVIGVAYVLIPSNREDQS